MLHHAGAMEVEELAPGLWRWSAALAGEEVWCLYIETPTATVLVDPVVPDEPERFFRALDRDLERRGLPLAILGTRPDATASAEAFEERYGVVALELPGPQGRTASPDSAER
jgi:hypothetical protein